MCEMLRPVPIGKPFRSARSASANRTMAFEVGVDDKAHDHCAQPLAQRGQAANGVARGRRRLINEEQSFSDGGGTCS